MPKLSKIKEYVKMVRENNSGILEKLQWETWTTTCIQKDFLLSTCHEKGFYQRVKTIY